MNDLHRLTDARMLALYDERKAFGATEYAARYVAATRYTGLVRLVELLAARAAVPTRTDTGAL